MKVILKVIFDRFWLAYIYFIVTAITTIQAAFKSSFVVGAAALLACGLCFLGTSTFVSSFLARRATGYSATELAGVGAIATALVAAGVALMIWSGFWLNIFGLAIDGRYWALVGILTALVTAKKEFVR